MVSVQRLAKLSAGCLRALYEAPCSFCSLYNYDLCNVSKVVDLIRFAHDSNIFFSHKDFYLRPEILNSGMLKLTLWCRANKLSINV